MNEDIGDLLTALFGEGASADPRERAASSSRLFVRGLDLLSLELSPKATGRRLTALEAYDAYGFAKLREVVEDGSAIVTSTPEAAGRVLRERRERLGIPAKTVANRAGLTVDVVEALERSARRPVREYERVARCLGLDERLLSFKSSAQGNERVAVRLRSLADDRPALSPSTVASLAEAAWVAMTQVRLEDQLSLSGVSAIAETTDYYGRPAYPAHRVGYDLADDLRHALGIGEDPIRSMRELAEVTLRIPIIQAALDTRIAGATVDSAGRRSIVLNIVGANSQAAVRRSTIAHELGHLLFDPPSALEDLRVDEYQDLDQRPEERADPVEQRANAFAVQLLAPQAAAVARYQSSGDLFAAVLDHFGVSFTAGRYQVWNGLQRSIDLASITAPNQPPEADWEARESYTLAYHPIRSLVHYPSRAGRFSAIAVRTAELGLVSWDTVAEWLYCSEDDARSAVPFLSDLYADVFKAERLV